MNLRPYQAEGVRRIHEALESHRSTIFVMATGLGKTVVFSSLLRERMSTGHALVLAHREELVHQAARKLHEVTGQQPGIEMADHRVRKTVFGYPPIVVSSVQTQDAGRPRRMNKFDPKSFSTIVVDEAHRAVSPQYRRVIDYYMQGNPDAKLLGVTATPDRLDGKRMREVFESVAYNYGIDSGVRDGWLVPLSQKLVRVRGLDFSAVRTVAGDFNQGELADLMRRESHLHGVADSVVQIAGDRRTLVFASSVKHAEGLCEILNRHRPNRAAWVCGKTPKDHRRDVLARYRRKELQYLVNVDVFTEGFDDPGIEVVAVARPTKSRAKYVQMVGRGTRTLPGVVDCEPTAEARRFSISISGKPKLEVIDFHGNAGRHELCSIADVLGDALEEPVRERVKKIMAEDDDTTLDDAVSEAKKQLDEEEAERERLDAELADARLREAKSRIVGRAEIEVREIDPFRVVGLPAMRSAPAAKYDSPMTEAQRKLLVDRFKVADLPPDTTRQQASKMIDQLIQRSKDGLCTYRQARWLDQYGYDSTSMTFEEASRICDHLAKQNKYYRKPKKQESAA